MTKITVANQAGSAGKTTFVVNAAAELVINHGKRVRVIDLDYQANATFHLGHTDAAEPTIYEVLIDRVPLRDAERQVQIRDGEDEDGTARFVDVPGLTIVPANRKTLEGCEIRLAGVTGAEQRIRLALEAAAHEEPDVITFIDCPGSLGTLTVAALIGSDVAGTVFSPQEKEAGAIGSFAKTVTDVAEAYNPNLELQFVVPSIVPPPGSGKYYTDVMDMVRGRWKELMTPPIRRSVRVGEAYSAQTPLALLEPSESVTSDIAAVVKDLINRGVL